MENIENGSKKGTKYDYSASDIGHFFEKQNLKFVIDHIIYKDEQTERSAKEIAIRMDEINGPGFNEAWWKELNEFKKIIKDSIHRYKKGKSNAEKLAEVSPIGLPSYISDNINKLIENRTIYHKTLEQNIETNFAGIYKAFKEIFNEYKDTPFSDKEIIKKILKVFYNAEVYFNNELERAEGEYEIEAKRRENENDSNDMYKKYDTLLSPKETARNNTYETFFYFIDPKGKFKEQNKKIFNIIITEFNTSEVEYKKKQLEQKNTLEEEKKTTKQEQDQKHAKLLKEYSKPEIKQQSTHIEDGSIQFEDIAIQTNKQQKIQEIMYNNQNDDRAKRATGGVYPHREGETPYD